ncbi:MAG: AAA family ATPase, partial [Acidimicrobiales bacterium]
MTRIALVTPDASFELDLHAALPDLGPGHHRRWKEEYLRIDPTKVAAEVTDDGADIVCIGPGLTPAVALQLANAFDLECPNVCVLVMAEPTPDLVHEALRVGVRDVVSPTGDPVELARALDRARETAERRLRAHEDAAHPPRSSRVITVVSPKGGTGKTTVATNLAVGLAKGRPGQVAIVDLDVQFGDVATALQLTPRSSLANVAACPDALTATMVKVFLTAHPSGLY